MLRANPDFEYKNRHQVFYEFSNGRTFLEDENLHGAYASSGPISISLAGVGASGGVGTVTQPPVLLDGVSAIGSASQIVGVGTLPVESILDGVGASGAAGLVTGQFPSAALGGVGANGIAGRIVVQTSSSTQVLLGSVSGIGSASPIAGKTIVDNVAVNGVLALATAGTIVIPPTNNVPLTGVSATVHAGTITTPPVIALRSDFSSPGFQSWFFY